jgi:hypothetical protein
MEYADFRITQAGEAKESEETRRGNCSVSEFVSTGSKAGNVGRTTRDIQSHWSFRMLRTELINCTKY